MAYSWNMKYITAALSIALFSTVSLVAAEDDSDCSGKKNCISKSTLTLPVRIGVIASVIAGITIGVCLPLLGRTFSSPRPDRNTFFVIRAFAAGLVLATASVQVFPDAFQSPTSEPSSWYDFPLPGFLAMLTALCILIVDALATGYSHLKNQNEPTDEVKELESNTKDSNGYTYGSSNIDGESRLRHRVISLVLELAIITQSAIVGISLGGSKSPWLILGNLMAAFTFQQFLEGMGLGGCLIQEGFNSKFPVVSTISALFSGVTTAIRLLSSESTLMAVIVEGVFITGSAGIMVYMCLVDLFAAYVFKSELQKRGALEIWAYMALLSVLGGFFLFTKLA